jgi:hypothetical protein
VVVIDEQRDGNGCLGAPAGGGLRRNVLDQPGDVPTLLQRGLEPVIITRRPNIEDGIPAVEFLEQRKQLGVAVAGYREECVHCRRSSV